MLLKIRTLFLLLAFMASTTVNADARVAKHSNNDKNNETGITLAMKQQLYEIQPDTSKIEFRADSPFGDVWGNFQDFEGSFIMENNSAHNQSVVVNIKADSLDADARFIRAILKSEIFFDVEKFPSVRFVGSSFEWFNETNAVLKGYLTIHDVTRPVAFYVELVDVDTENQYSERITVKATTTIKRSKFGIYSMLPAVSDDVNLFLSIDAVKKDTAVSIASF